MRSRDDVNSFIQRIRPYCTELYRRAYAIMANSEAAKYVVQNVIVEAYPLYLDWQGRVNFRESVYELVRRISLDELRVARDSGDFEQDTEEMLERLLYTYAVPESGDAALQPLYTRVLREKSSTRRMLMLRYGCGLNTAQIAAALQMRQGDIRDKMRLCQARLFHGVKKNLGGGQLKALEAQLVKLSGIALKRQDDDIPEMSAVFELFSENIEHPHRKSGKVGRVIQAVLLIIGTLVCALLFWLVAVLLEPHRGTVPQDTPAPYEISATYSSYKLH